MKLNLDALNIDSFDTGANDLSMTASYVEYTVLYETEQHSCGGSCGTCPCYA